MLRFFVLADLVDRKKYSVELDARLGDGDERRIGHLFRTQGPEARDGADQRFHLDGALARQAAQCRDMKATGFAALDEPVARKFIERPLQTLAVPPGRVAGLLHLEHTEARFKEIDDFVAGDAV